MLSPSPVATIVRSFVRPLFVRSAVHAAVGDLKLKSGGKHTFHNEQRCASSILFIEQNILGFPGHKWLSRSGIGWGGGDSLTNNVRRKVARKKKLKRKLMIHVRPPRPQRSHYSSASVRSFGILASMPFFLPCVSALCQEVQPYSVAHLVAEHCLLTSKVLSEYKLFTLAVVIEENGLSLQY